MDEMLNRLSRRKFVMAAGAAALGSIALKGCSSAATNQPTQTSAPISADDETALYEAAKKEGKLVLYTVFFTQDIVNEIGAAFTQKYPGITFEGTRNTASTLFQKVQQEMQAGLKVTDFFGTTDISQMMQLKEQGNLLQYAPAGKDNVLAQYRDLDPDNFYQAGALIPIVIAYNTQKLQAANAPKSWQELIQDKYKDQIATGSGAASGQVGTWALAMDQKYGWDNYITKLNQLNPKLGRSINDVMPVLTSGERSLGIATLGQTLSRKAKGDPIDAIYPSDGAVIVVGPNGILKNAPHPNAAKLFMNFVNSKEYSELVAKYYEQPLRSDVTINGAQTVAQMNAVTLKPDEIHKGIPDVIRKWRTEFGA
ncbi:ABC transporter substrate-binding protein [Leptolyngbya ohadii]|uniref:ABC transporter substrate-binding protein n=1 Tax=Leptolyngbya ohadii TaxID=1962290 RepID=UPI0015C5FBFA|nr:extracellular solute-binding protein [Leptolyngbya ohadii]